jgi:asparagine synthetase B (glutamine-hydrolysing)
MPERLRMTSLEELWAVPIGRDPLTDALSEQASFGSLRQALEAAVLPALRRPPCVVSFSGGVDSSIVLALAVHVARREGLPLPIPITNCFPALEEADEAEWQERVISHLGIEDWTRLEWNDELDILGPMATQILRRHGVLTPFNSHFHYPLLEQAAGGSLLSGIGGDELFESVSRAGAARVLVQHRRPHARDLRSVAFALAPRALRARVNARRLPFDRYDWILPLHRRRLAHAYRSWESREPLRYDRALREWWWPSRGLQCGLASMRVLAADFDVQMRSPLVDPDVLAACAHAGGRAGLGTGSRARGFESIVGDLLPHEVIWRRSKASFTAAFWTGHARTFVERWDGRGVDHEKVDVELLRAQWSLTAPDPHSFQQLRRAWLASQPD